MAPHGEERAPSRPAAAHRDADEEALQAALRESMQPDYMAEILQAEQAIQHRSSRQAAVATAPRGDQASVVTAKESGDSSTSEREEDDEDEDDAEEELGVVTAHVATVSEAVDAEEEQEDPNLEHTLLNFAEPLLVDLLSWLDEDSIGACVCSCKRLLQLSRSEVLFERVCRRIYPAQCPKVAAAVARNRFALRRFPSWFSMFHDRPRVRYNGFYWLRVVYYKKPEPNMWSDDVTPDTILRAVYYRYFCFQRDGSVLYAMLFKPPYEVVPLLRSQAKGVYRGQFCVEKDEVSVNVATHFNCVNFRLSIGHRDRGRNVKLVLHEHSANSEPDGSGWTDDFETKQEVFQFYPCANL